MTSMFQTLWSSGDSSGLLRLAKDIENHESWRGFLTIQEHDLFKYALDKGGQVWHEFISGNATCRMEQPSPESSTPTGTATPAPNKIEKSPFTNGHSQPISTLMPAPSPSPMPVGNVEEKQAEHLQLDGVSVAFRVRYMLYEKSIGLMFPPLDPTISPDIDYAIFEEEKEDKPAPAPTTARKVDDDYDDDDDEEEDEKAKADKKPELAVTESDLTGKPIILSM